MTVSLFFDSGLYYVYSNKWGYPEVVTCKCFPDVYSAFDYTVHLLKPILN